MKAEEFVGTWGIYAFSPSIEVLVAPQDVEVVKRLFPTVPQYYGHLSVYHCVNYDSGFLILEDNFLGQFGVKPEQYITVPEPIFRVGDKVRLKKKPELVRKILHIIFHYWNKEIVYRVECSDKIGFTYWYAHQLLQENM